MKNLDLKNISCFNKNVFKEIKSFDIKWNTKGFKNLSKSMKNQSIKNEICGYKFK